MSAFLKDSTEAHAACSEGYIVELLDVDGNPNVTMYPGTIADYGRDKRDDEIERLRADANRYRWAVPILCALGDEGDKRAMALAMQLMKGLDGDAAVDAAIASL